ncbi:hypothetical protein JCM10908_006783 [Rhodotorula pacifica]|uniref:uncharacterized protein n=1 Tax=Rhodotorula pacifica TaxID=1495444 RepID=UPI0031748704
MPQAPASKQIPPRASKPRTNKTRMRFVPVRLPPPVKLVDLARKRAAANSGAPAHAQTASAELEKADLAAPAKKPARRQPTFRFATGPGAKRAPTRMYDLPTSSIVPSEQVAKRNSPDSPIKSAASSNKQPQAAADIARPSAVAHTDQEQPTPAPERHLRRLSIIPTFRLSPNSAGSNPAPSSLAREEALGNPGSHSPTNEDHMLAAASVVQPTASQHGGLKATADLAPSGPPRLSSAAEDSPVPAPSGRRIRSWLATTGAAEQADPGQERRNRSRTTSSDSSGIWSRLPSQFDHRFDIVKTETPPLQDSYASDEDQYLGPTTASLEAAAEMMHGVGATFQLEYGAEMQIPDSQLELPAEAIEVSALVDLSKER